MRNSFFIFINSGLSSDFDFAALADHGAGEADLCRNVDDERQIRMGGLDDEQLEGVEQLPAKRTVLALIDTRRIHEAVAQDKIAAVECRPDRFPQVRFPRRIIEQCLGGCRPAADRASDEKRTDIFGSGRTAGLARQDDLPSFLAQGLGKITVGDLTILFQFVTPPPPQPRPARTPWSSSTPVPTWIR